MKHALLALFCAACSAPVLSEGESALGPMGYEFGLVADAWEERFGEALPPEAWDDFANTTYLVLDDITGVCPPKSAGCTKTDYKRESRRIIRTQIVLASWLTGGKLVHARIHEAIHWTVWRYSGLKHGDGKHYDLDYWGWPDSVIGIALDMADDEA